MPFLPADRHGAGPTFLWLHGFTQTRHAAEKYRTILTGDAAVVTPDLPGHGAAAPLHASLPQTATWLLADFLPRPSAVGGYSMGGRVALHVALAAPQQVTGLVLVSTSMGIADEDARRERRERDAALASHIRAVGANQFLNEWLQTPLFASLSDADLASRSSDAEGLAQSLEHAGTATQDYVADQVSTLTMPLLVVYGEHDAKFARAAAEIADVAPNAHVVMIPGAGHAVHLEQPDRTASVVAEFLRSLA